MPLKGVGFRGCPSSVDCYFRRLVMDRGITLTSNDVRFMKKFQFGFLLAVLTSKKLLKGLCR